MTVWTLNRGQAAIASQETNEREDGIPISFDGETARIALTRRRGLFQHFRVLNRDNKALKMLWDCCSHEIAFQIEGKHFRIAAMPCDAESEGLLLPATVEERQKVAPDAPDAVGEEPKFMH